MQFGNNGKMVFSTIEELFSDLFMEIGLAVKNNYVYLQGGDFLKCGDKFIKVSLDGSPVYPGSISYLSYTFPKVRHASFP